MSSHHPIPKETLIPENPGPHTRSIDLAPFSRTRFVRFAGGFFLFGLLWAVANSAIASVILPQRLTDLGVSNPAAVLGTVFAATAIVSLVSNLLVGNLSDRSRSRFGRRTPWVLAGAIVAGVSLMFTVALPTASLMAAAYCAAIFGLNMMIAPIVAVIFDQIPFRARGTMSAAFGGGGTAGYPLGAIVGAAFISAPTTGGVVAGIAMLLSGILCIAVWPREGTAAQIPREDAGSLRDLLKSFRPPRNAPDFYKALVGRLFMILSYQMINGYQLYIIQNYMGQSTAHSASTLATSSSIALVVGIVSSLLGGPLSDKLKRRKVPVIAASLLFALGVLMPWLIPSSLGIFLYAGIAGFGFGLYSSVDQALNVDVLPRPEKAGEDLGILNLATTAGQTIGPVLTSAVVVAAGSYSAIFPISIAAAVIGSVSILWIKSVR